MSTHILAPQSRKYIKELIDLAPDGFIVRITASKKSRAQEEKYHAMIDEISSQFVFCNRKWDAEDMKRLLIDQYRRDTASDADYKDLWAQVVKTDLAPSLDGSGVVALGIQSKRFPKKLASGFIEWLYHFGADNGIEFKEGI